MKYYKHHIGDFDRATRHLTRLERSVYRDMLDMYYDTEKSLPIELPAICRKIIANSNEESTAVESSLNEFFTRTPTGWYHDRCESEIETYYANNSQKAEAGKASARKRSEKRQLALNENSTGVEIPLNENSTNHKPLTTNHKPLKELEGALAPNDEKAQAIIAEGLDVATWTRWLNYRKQIHKPIKLASMLAAQKQLAGFGSDQAAVVEQSIAAGYTGLFDLKSGKGPPCYQNRQDISQAAGRQMIEAVYGKEPWDEDNNAIDGATAIRRLG